MPPGYGVRVHQHPDREIFTIQEGRATFAVGSTTREVHPGQVIFVPANTPHKFKNTGERPLRQVDIYVSREFIT